MQPNYYHRQLISLNNSANVWIEEYLSQPRSSRHEIQIGDIKGIENIFAGFIIDIDSEGFGTYL